MALTFHPLTLCDREAMQAVTLPAGRRNCNYTFPTLWDGNSCSALRCVCLKTKWYYAIPSMVSEHIWYVLQKRCR